MWKEEHPDRVRAFLQGYMAAVKLARSNPGEAKRVIGKYTKTIDQEDLEETIRPLSKFGNGFRTSLPQQCKLY